MPHTTTKRALALSLKKRLKEKPLDKITIKDICDGCGVNRQTFYYHFQDIYDLIEWIYTSAEYQILDENMTLLTWEDALMQIFDYALQEKEFVIATYHSLSREHLENFLYRETYRPLHYIIKEHCADISIQDKDIAFLADFYKYAFVGIVLEWVRKGMKEDPAPLIYKMKLVTESSFNNIIDYYVHNLHQHRKVSD